LRTHVDIFGYQGKSQFIPGIQRFYELASAIVANPYLFSNNLVSLSKKALPYLFGGSLLNDRVFSGYQYTPALRVENIYSAVPVNYSLDIRMAVWKAYTTTKKRPWWHKFWYGNAGTK
jgi:hypothetical protein